MRTSYLTRRIAESRARPAGARGLRQHANPLALRFYDPPVPPVWGSFATLDAPLHLDIGCGEGTMLVDLARLHPGRNHLGIDIREGALSRAREQLRADPVVSQQRNCHFALANLELSHHLWLPYPGVLDIVTIFHPDPLLKTSQRAKRRLVSPAFALALAAYSTPGRTRLHVQSDVESIFEDITTTLQNPATEQLFLRDVPDPILGPFEPLRSMREARVLARHNTTTASGTRQLGPLPITPSPGFSNAGLSQAEALAAPPRIWRASYLRTLASVGGPPPPPLHPLSRVRLS